MAVHFDFWKYFLDLLISVDDKGGSLNSHKGAAHKRFLLEDAVLFGCRLVLIGKQWERKLVLRDELFVGIDRIETDAKNLGVGGLKLFPEIPKIARFFCATRRIILWIEIKNEAFLSFKILKAYIAPVTRGKRKFRSFVTFF